MDPFARDSETEDERASAKETTRTDTDAGERSTARQSSVDDKSRGSSRSRVNDKQAGDEEEDGPPASLVLDAHSDEEEQGELAGPSHTRHASGDAARSVKSPLANALNVNDNFGVEESVQLSQIKGRDRNTLADQEDMADDLGAQDDEDAGLLAGQSSRHTAQSPHKRSRRAKRPRDPGMLSYMWHKIQQGAEQIQAQDGMATATAARARRLTDHGILNGGPAGRLSPKERALWRWGTLHNMDEFLQEAYAYYVGKGLACILLTKTLNLLTIAFVIAFSTFLVGCVDYSSIKHDGKLSDVVVEHCVSRFSGITVLFFALFVGVYAWQVVRFGLGVSKLIAMNHFFTYLLDIPDADVQAISWSEIVNRIAKLRDTHPTTSLSHANDATQCKLDAHDVANRIMRQENYLVALFNKDVLNLTVPLPGFSGRTPELTRSLEWNLSFCLLGYLFDRQGQVRKPFVQERHRAELIDGLRRRFVFMAVINAIFAPFIVLYLLFYSFFRYFEEYHKNPSYLGSRQYTQFARWKFREFNELPHLFRMRCHNSYPFAQRYIDQFPKERTAILARFVSFVAGSFTAVLLLASVIDPDLFVHFDITPQRNVLFYIGVFGAILAVSRALTPDDRMIFDPELMLRAVIEYTHYSPDRWQGRFHSADVHAEFSSLYRLKLSIFVGEILSVIVTPFILWKSLPRSAPAIIDFFREFTVHVDSLGYVCSFAVFDFQKHGNTDFGAPQSSRSKRMTSKEGKMEQSLLGFQHANPSWQPTDPLASVFLSRLAREARETEATSERVPGIFTAATAREEGQESTSPRQAQISKGANANVNFTPANSVLAQRSQLYADAFERSILLASKPSNAMALQASATKTGPRSVPSALQPSRASAKQHANRYLPRDRHAHGRGLQAVEENSGDAIVMPSSLAPLSRQSPLRALQQDARNNDDSSLLVYEDAHPEAQNRNQSSTSFSSRLDEQARQPASLRELLQHIGTSRW